MVPHKKVRHLEEEVSHLRDYAMLVEQSLTGIYIDQDGKIVLANERFAEIYGYPEEELLGMESRKLVHPEDRPLTDKIRKRRLKSKTAPSEYEAREITKRGETLWVRRRNTSVVYRGKPAILGNVVDISQQKAAEEQLHKINEDMKNLLQVVSHDLRTPVISMHGLASRLLKSRKFALDQNGKDYLERIMDCAERADALITDLRALSRIGRVDLELRDCSIGEIIAKIVSHLEPKLREKSIDLALAENFPTAFCHEKRIYQVFENLIVNAVKYMGLQDNPRIEVGYEDNGEFHRFFVRDNGTGIDPKNHEEIFKKFKRIKTDTKQEGTGLGLSIVRGIVENHGGRVGVESEEDKGSTFYFTLPKKPKKKAKRQRSRLRKRS
jgi:two-component system sensor kinase FixL